MDNYRFSKNDMDTKWHVYGAPRDVKDLMEKKVRELDKDKVEFSKSMEE